MEGLRNCLNDVEFYNFVYNFDILFFQETWQRKNDIFEIKGYELISVPRKESLKSHRGHGGISLFFRKELSKGIVILEIDHSGILWVKCCKKFFHLPQDLYICFLYIPPSNSVYYNVHELGFFETLELGVRKYLDFGSVTVIGDLNARCGNRSDFIQKDTDFNKYIHVMDTDLNCVLNNMPHRFSMDETVNTSGLKLLDICKCSTLKIVNGRCGNNAGIGSHTNISSNGNSLIDYVLCSCDLFPLIKDFIVHDLYTFSTHVPLQVSFSVACVQEQPYTGFIADEGKIRFNMNKVQEFRDVMNSEYNYLINIVSDIISSDINIDTGVDRIASCLYEKACNVFGTKSNTRISEQTNCHNNNTWFNAECKSAKRELRNANRNYRRLRSSENRDILVIKRRRYKQMKRKAKSYYNNKKKTYLHELAKKCPQKFWSEIKKFKSSAKGSSKLNEHDFFQHFKNLYGDDNVFCVDDIDEQVNTDTDHDSVIDELDNDFSVDEVERALSSLKRGKSGGIDLLIPEIFIECKHTLAPVLRDLFNYMYANSIYPINWTKGIIVPVPKKGDLDNVNNYRGITLTSIFSKIFSILLDNRLRKWSENSNVLDDVQFGFRKGKSTVDCVFVLSSIINKVLNYEKRKLYLAFVDFRKAFDIVYRNGIWYKLSTYGVSSKIMKILKVMYENVKSCVKVNGSLTEYFDTYMGVKQGEPLSPLLFLFFINDMHSQLADGNIDTFSVDELQVFLLLFADDTVLFSYSAQGLQLLLNKLHDYCTKWGIHVNTDKTVVMLCKNNNVNDNTDIFYNNEKLHIVKKFTYLGVTLSSNGKYYQTQKVLAVQASKAMYSLNSLFDKVPMDISEKLQLFDVMVLPILNYGSEIWGFHKAPDIERLHTKFLKQLMGVRQQTVNSVVYGELKRFPLRVCRKIRILKYLQRLKNNPESLMYKVFCMSDYSGNIVNKWSKDVRVMLDDLGFSHLWNCVTITNVQLHQVIQRVKDQYIQQWFHDIHNMSKLSTYCLFKDEFTIEKYVSCISNMNHFKALCRFRCSAHNLLIEEGRHRNIARENRICNYCNMNTIENEYHFLLVCPFYRQIRNENLPSYYCSWPTINKFRNIMKCNQIRTIKKLAKFIYLANCKRVNI